MTRVHPAEGLRDDMHRLLDSLSRYWPADAIAYVREEVGYGEYADALQNLVAIGVRDGLAVDGRDHASIERLFQTMGMPTDVMGVTALARNEVDGHPSRAAG